MLCVPRAFIKMRYACLLLAPVLCAAASDKPRSIIFIVADDLGYNDLGAYNGNKTISPHIDALVRKGISLTDYYTFKICSPSRAAMLTGRYPWGVGFYDMSHDTMHCTSNFTSLPSLLRDLGYKTHALGKWDVGFMEKQCAPIARGFDTFFGYYDACTADYWYHMASGGYNLPKEGCHSEDGMAPVDFCNSTVGDQCAAAAGVNGTYNRELFSDEAVRLIRAHDQSKPMYMYLAFMNIHDACAPGKDYHGLQAPKRTVDLYAKTKLDAHKVTGAMITELDYGVGEVIAALKETSMFDSTVLVLVSDNGGPLMHSANAPLRGGKHTFWEGGIRVRAVVGGSGSVIPAARRGTEWHGLAHSSDWYHTFVEGIAGGRVPADTGPRPSDGFDLWGALTSNDPSPRTEVVHQVSNAFFDENFVGIRMGNMKLMVGSPGDPRRVAWPEPEATDVPLGLTGATIEPGTDHVRSLNLATFYSDHIEPRETLIADERLSSPSGNVQLVMKAWNGNLVLQTTSANPKPLWMSHTPGHPGGYAVLQGDGSFAVRGNWTEGQPVLWSSPPHAGASRLEVRDNCDLAVVDGKGAVLWHTGTSCPSLASSELPPSSWCRPYCLFNLTDDVAEEHDLARVEDPIEKAKWDDLAQKMKKRLQFHGATGGPQAFLYDTATFKTKTAEVCDASVLGGVLEPLDCNTVHLV